MYTKKGARVEPLTPELVEKFRKLPPLPGEREPKPSRLARQREWVAAQLYTGTEWAEVLDKSTGVIHRCNGQHSVTTLSNLDGLRFPVRPDGTPLPAIIEEWEMDDVKRDGLKLFDCFDNPICARSNADRMCMVKAAHPDVKHLKSTFLISVCNAVEEYKRQKDANYTPIDARFRGEEMLDDQHVREFALFLAQFASSENRDFLRRVKAMSVAFATWLEDEDCCRTFWCSVFNEDDPDPQSESRLLAEDLKAARVRIKKGEKLRSTAVRAWKRYLTFARKKAAA